MAGGSPLLRALLVGLLEKHDFDVVGQVADGDAALEKCRRLWPDVLISTFALTGLSGPDIVRALRDDARHPRTLLVGVRPDAELASRALAAGAVGYAAMDTSPAELVRAVKDVALGRQYVPENLEHDPDDRCALLTEREFQVMCGLAEGTGGAKLASRLSVTPERIEEVRERVLARLRLEGDRELAHYAVARGFIVG